MGGKLPAVIFEVFVKNKFNMKNFNVALFTLLVMAAVLPANAFAQAGITTGEPIVIKAATGFDSGTGSSTSAIKQLEQMTGKTITKTVSSQSFAKNVSVAKPAVMSTQQMIGMQLASGLVSALFSFLLSDNSNNSQAEAQRAAWLAEQAAKEKRYNDSVAQVKYVKLMSEYKGMDDEGAVHFKQLSNSNLQIKPLGSGAPMTQDEIMRKKITGSGSSVTWDYNSWAQVQPEDKTIKEPVYVPEPNGPDEFMDKMIEKVDEFEGGKIAAMTGRLMKNIKNETMSYVKDASDAVISGNVARMEEAGNFELKKLAFNAMRKTGEEMALSYVGSEKDDFVDDIKDKNFEIIKGFGVKMLDKYNIYGHVSDAWKVPLRKY